MPIQDKQVILKRGEILMDIYGIFNPGTVQGAITCGVIGSIIASVIVSIITSNVVTKKIIKKYNLDINVKNDEKISAFGISNKVNYKSKN